jgi:hypothetical protein
MLVVNHDPAHVGGAARRRGNEKHWASNQAHGFDLAEHNTLHRRFDGRLNRMKLYEIATLVRNWRGRPPETPGKSQAS